MKYYYPVVDAKAQNMKYYSCFGLGWVSYAAR